MKIINVDKFKELDCQETNYLGILNFFKSFTEDWYSSRNIYFERHHLYPVSETKVEIPIIVNLPYKYHFLAHYYRAKESDEYRTKLLNYNACQVMIGKNKNVEYIKQNFPKEFYEMKQWIINNPRGTKMVIDLETMEVFKSVRAAGEHFGIDYHRIIMICKKQDEYYKNSCYKTKYLMYYDSSKSFDYYKSMYEKFLSIPKRPYPKQSDDSIKKSAESRLGSHFVQRKTKGIIDLTCGVVYSSTTEAERRTGIERHKILQSCKERREVFVRKCRCNFRYIGEENLGINMYPVEPSSHGEKMFLDKLSNFNGTSNSGRVKTVLGQCFNSILEMSKVTGMSRSTIQRYIGKFVFNQN